VPVEGAKGEGGRLSAERRMRVQRKGGKKDGEYCIAFTTVSSYRREGSSDDFEGGFFSLFLKPQSLIVALKRAVGLVSRMRQRRLSAEAVESASLALESVDHVHSRDGLAFRVLAVGDRVADDVLQKHLKDVCKGEEAKKP